MWKITINKEKCSSCGECLSNCPGDVYELHKSKAIIANPEEITHCKKENLSSTYLPKVVTNCTNLISYYCQWKS
jgi:NAD-dependent dihydropyrimidine dehydrogenase PreA subunit